MTVLRMKKIFYCLVMAGILPTCSCHSSLQSEGIGKADSIHVEYCGMGGTTRYVIDHSDTLTMLHGVTPVRDNRVSYTI